MRVKVSAHRLIAQNADLSCEDVFFEQLLRRSRDEHVPAYTHMHANENTDTVRAQICAEKLAKLSRIVNRALFAT